MIGTGSTFREDRRLLKSFGIGFPDGNRSLIMFSSASGWGLSLALLSQFERVAGYYDNPVACQT